MESEEQVAQSPSQHAKFRRVYTTHHAAIRDYCFRRLPPADANDATAEVFVVVWRKIDTVPAGDRVLPYLYGIARNTVANARRSHRRRGRLDGRASAQHVEFVEGPEAQVVQRDEARRILGGLEHLSETEQELLRLKAWEQLSNAQIAEAMGISLRAVDSRLTRARKKLARRANLASPLALPRSSEKGGER
ncbi:MAG TPA: sigma-70 family RNA polymerase sigma factor [Acidimicrobiia bacterium]|jgi:RNA polymerase sigma-70 factor (ECF subfamily)|nr:sigma-70 family RNA polymerase sigma factor [Acidimicrobiia bacterium]